MRDDPHPTLRKPWPLLRALCAAGLLTGLNAGCALTDGSNKVAETGPGVQIRPVPMVVRGAEGSEGRYALGKYYFYQGRLEKAEKAFIDAVRLDPDNAEALNGLGAVYDRMGRFEDAVAAYRAALARAPNSPHILANLGYSLKLAGHPVEAVTPLQQALSIEPENPITQAHLGAALAAAAVGEAAAVQPPPARTVAKSVAPGVPAVGSAESSVTNTNGQSVAPAEVISAKVAPAPAGLIASVVRAAPSQPPASVVDYRGAPDKAATPIIQTVPGRVAGPEPVKVAVLPPGANAKQMAFTPEPVPMPAPAVVATLASPQPGLVVRIEVSNGNGVKGMARAVGTELRQEGLNVTRITNARPFDKARTLIVFNRQYEGQAMSLARALPAAPTLVAGDISHRGVDLRVVLGADAALAMSLPEGRRFRLAAAGAL